MDRVILEGLQFFGHHGVNPEETALGQRFVVDVALVVDLRPAGQADDLTKTVNYSHVYKAIKSVVEGEPRKLIEAVAESIAATLLERFPAESVTVRVDKPSAPIAGAVFGRVGVEITRRRSG